ncbi:MAG: hypothetical protein H6573_27640 [Lewinellaceae bacterium]|nr:hypothetical protein [Lewinellaceae bacterium]
MPLFQIDKNKASLVKASQFPKEKELQQLIERNLEAIFNCRFVATEFSTGAIHGGRIDTLALSEDNNPVIIEYKIKPSSDLINQSLFYLSWMKDHQGDFQVAVGQQLGNNIEVDWSGIRVICIAPEYKKYDLHAVRMMGANIELWQYKIYENGSLFLEEVFQKSSAMMELGHVESGKGGAGLTTGQKAAETRRTASYEFDDHLEGKSQNIREIVTELREYILSLDESIEEAPKKFYVAYRTSQNFVCLEIQKSKVLLFLKIKAEEFDSLPPNSRDVSNIGHFATGDFEYTIKALDDIELARELIQRSFANIGE